ncbi:flavin reductase (DIM6/NTAB) family NADH-FMN oxidoreductase RutF [Azospirillum lipoferum]|uniref:Flavin reductase family protein n=1 Tax=Azospirillum lipoferum TaxID=193 RepID=A0A5A9GPQ0_AZOLI|nr:MULTISPECIES: flavin reductase family protein [Azospirillum]KAA0595584.1 flavin reductase family protein [Azospirillum lipoferum]MCP1611565.1 flavin reductase (DIM6/NTAB) family NADH-FMN oxidoreductase RutF [Azospirillum lipoferum]MDW5537365.1 flavin reductase family protein [Azospirillum sp. NL1]
MSGQDFRVPEYVETAAFKSALRTVVGSVSIVASGQGADRRGLTVTAAVSLCVDPPMVLACINRSAEAHDVILRTGAFSWNVLSADQVQLAERFAALDGSKGASRFSPADWGETVTGVPVLRQSVCSFDCRLQDAVEVATHTIMIGAVVSQSHAQDKVPLIYSSGRFGRMEYFESDE